MTKSPLASLAVVLSLSFCMAPYDLCASTTADTAGLPTGVQAVWELGRAEREATATRERICINGLWRWQPAARQSAPVPAGDWGFFKVPGCWPGITDYMQKDCQTVYAHPAWHEQRLSAVTAAWYQREITIPAAWTGRRIWLAVECLNSHAAVYVDGQEVGDLRFPGGELDLTSRCQAGATHVLSLHVVALPLKGALLSYTDTNSAREVEGAVARRGLCGDVYLVSTPRGPRVADVNIDTSVRQREITFDVALEELALDERYQLLARISASDGQAWQLRSKTFGASQLHEGRITFRESWIADRLWDIHTPRNQYEVTLSLQQADGRLCDAAFRQRFGFREFWIDGRDFYLNGTRIFLCAVPLDNAQVGAAWASYDGARESLSRLKSLGINFVYTHNYGCEPGAHLSFAQILRAADDVGMLVALSQPHFAQYDWQPADADQNNGYAQHAAAYVKIAQNHPSVVAYSMSHNACGYEEDMNPDMIDGRVDPRSGSYAQRNVQRALRAEAIVKKLDPARIVYHHAGGNIGSMYTVNFYPNFVPIQEMSDWFEHWSTQGVKPLFTCEYGAPFMWDWAMYRGWYQGEREFGSARVPWEFCLAEWNAQFLGDRAFQLGEPEQANLRWEANQLRAGRVWHRWDYPHNLNSDRFVERYEVIARYLADNWPAFRTWEVSALSPWEYGQYWTLRDGVDRRRQQLPVDWQRLQRTGFSPDYIESRYERIDLAFDPRDWQPTAAAGALLRYNRPVLGYLAGQPAAFTSKHHLFCPGESFEKQAVVINNSRETVTCHYTWSFGTVEGDGRVAVPTGRQERIPIEVDLPATIAPGTYALQATFEFSNQDVQHDALAIHVVPRPDARPSSGDAKIAVWDPLGETRVLLDRLGVRCQTIDTQADVTPYDVLIVGKAALTTDGPAPHLERVREGLRVIVFEQTAAALERRLGFRVAEYGLRQVVPRIPDHPLLAGIAADHLRDWRGSATLVPPQLAYELQPRLGPTVTWCDIRVPRLWRCGNRGNVASVLIEKPTNGDFLPVLDGGYSLQYSPLLEHRVGRGTIIFCQLDVTGRSDNDPVAETLVRRLLQYASTWQPPIRRVATYVGEAAGQAHLESSGIALQPYEAAKLSANHVLVVGPGGGERLTSDAAIITSWLQGGGRLLAIGLDETDVRALPLSQLRLRKTEHISAYFAPPNRESPLVGVGPADVHNRDPRELPLVESGATVLGDGVLATGENGSVVFCQMAPWQFGNSDQPNLRKTYRRSSYLISRLLANLGVESPTPLATRLGQPVEKTSDSRRWQEGLYVDTPEEWDDPYRFFRW